MERILFLYKCPFFILNKLRTFEIFSKVFNIIYHCNLSIERRADAWEQTEGQWRGFGLNSDHTNALKTKARRSQFKFTRQKFLSVNNSGAEAAVYFIAFYKENVKLFAVAYGI